MKVLEQIMAIFPLGIRERLQASDLALHHAEELRLRAGRPLFLVAGGGEWYLEKASGKWRRSMYSDQLDEQSVYFVSPREIKETIEYMSRYSLYAYEDELRQGFLTIQGGHRIGLAGQAVLEQQQIKTLKYLSFLNIRIARQVIGCADPLLPYLYGEQLYSTLIISPPGCGKTTLLRDLIRQVSTGWAGEGRLREGMNVGVVDERGELAACYQGVPQHSLGYRTDVLDCCPKAEGILMLIRSMAPRVVAVDEIGGKNDVAAIRYSKNCGCILLATIHGSSYEDIMEKPEVAELIKEKAFSRFVVLKRAETPGRISALLDGQGRSIW